MVRHDRNPEPLRSRVLKFALRRAHAPHRDDTIFISLVAAQVPLRVPSRPFAPCGRRDAHGIRSMRFSAADTLFFLQQRMSF
jgi:hypothetical protein